MGSGADAPVRPFGDFVFVRRNSRMSSGKRIAFPSLYTGVETGEVSGGRVSSWLPRYPSSIFLASWHSSVSLLPVFVFSRSISLILSWICRRSGLPASIGFLRMRCGRT